MQGGLPTDIIIPYVGLHNAAVSTDIKSFFRIMGPTGSGKSTVSQGNE